MFKLNLLWFFQPFIALSSLAAMNLCLSLPVEAAQDYFHKEETPTEIAMQYRWQDNFGTRRNISFKLDRNKLAAQKKINKAYRPEIAQRYVFIALQRAAQKIDPKEARVRFFNRGSDTTFDITSRSNEIVNKWMNELANVKESAFVEFLQMNYYDRYESPYGQKGVKPDHKRFVAENITALLPAAQAIYEQLDEDSTSRAYVNLMLSWIQSIPYNALQDRMTSNGAGFLSPTDVITSNIGDCDSKTVLLASMLRSLLPNLNMTIVYLPEHALLGANLPFFEGEETVKEAGLEYLLLDPTGPSLMKVGEVSGDTTRFIANNMYRLDKIP